MAGTISISAGTEWSAASWLFGWVLEAVASQSRDEQLKAYLTERVEENTGWLSLDDLAAGQRDAVRQIISTSLMDVADRELPESMPGRPATLALLTELVSAVSAGQRSAQEGE
jgi:hypothetical protein